MLAYLIICFFLFAFSALIWRSGDLLNTMVKVFLIAQTVWTLIMIFSLLFPKNIVFDNGMRLW